MALLGGRRHGTVDGGGGGRHDQPCVVEFQDGDDVFIRKRPGVARFGDVTLEKGYIVTDDLFAWWRAAFRTVCERRTLRLGSVATSLESDGNDVSGEEAISALVNLGYSRGDAFNAVAKAGGQLGAGAALDELIRVGLKEMSQ